RRHLLTWGSANATQNAGNLNAEVIFVLDSPDPELGVQMRHFFSGLLNEKRMRPYLEAYLEKRLLETFRVSPEVYSPEFLEKLETFLLAEKKNHRTYRALVTKLEKARAQNLHGKNLLKIL